jgi:hypothetical protein
MIVLAAYRKRPQALSTVVFRWTEPEGPPRP